MQTSFRPLVIAGFAAFGLFSCSTSDSNMNDSTQPEFNESQFSAAPVAEKKEHITEIHSLELKDDYFWMRLSDAQKEAETPDEQTAAVVDYLNAENDYKTEVLKPTEAFQESLFEEIVGRIVAGLSAEEFSLLSGTFEGTQFLSRIESGMALHLAGDLEAGQRARIFGYRVLAESLQDVGTVNAGGGDADQHLPRRRLGHRQARRLQDVGRPR